MAPADRNAPHPPFSPPRRFGFWSKPALLVASLVVTFVTIEVGMRFAGVKPQTATVLSTYFEFDEQTGWRGKPNAASRFTTTNFDVFISHDADGFRRCGYERPIAADVRAEHRVVWVLGDSGTWGWGVDDGRTYVDLLNRMSTDGTRYRNLGHCGFSSLQEFLLLKNLFGRGFAPDEVVVLYCGNDLAENVDGVDQRPPRAYLQVAGDVVEVRNYPTSKAGWGLSTWLKNHSLAWNHAHFYATRLKQRLKDESMRTTPPTPTAARPSQQAETRLFMKSTSSQLSEHASPEQLTALRHVYRSMNELCRARGVKLYLVNDGPPVVPAVCEELGIAWFDLSRRWSEYYASPEGSQPWCFPTDPHFNELGHRLIAEGIHGELLRMRRATSNVDAAARPETPAKTR